MWFLKDETRDTQAKRKTNMAVLTVALRLTKTETEMVMDPGEP